MRLLTVADAQKKVNNLFERFKLLETPESFEELAKAVEEKQKLERRLENERKRAWTNWRMVKKGGITMYDWFSLGYFDSNEEFAEMFDEQMNEIEIATSAVTDIAM